MTESVLRKEADSRSPWRRDVTLVGGVRSCEDAQQCGLPGTVRTGETYSFPFGNVPSDVLEEDLTAEALSEGLDLLHGLALALALSMKNEKPGS